MKEVIWNKEAKAFVRKLDDKTKKDIGTLLMTLQSGHTLGEPISRPMRGIHPNAFELKVKDARGSYRVIYVMVVKNTIIIPHAFTKKTQETPLKEIETSKKRLRDILERIL